MSLQSLTLGWGDVASDAYSSFGVMSLQIRTLGLGDDVASDTYTWLW